MDDRFEFAVDAAYGNNKTKWVSWQQNVAWDNGTQTTQNTGGTKVKSMNVYEFLQRPDKIRDNTQALGSQTFSPENNFVATDDNWGKSRGSFCFDTVANAEAEIITIRRVQDSLVNIKNDGLVAVKRIKASIDISTKALVTLQQGLDNAIETAVTDVLKQLLDALSYHQTRLDLYEGISGC